MRGLWPKLTKKAEFEAGGFEVILNLRSMSIRQFLHGFEFDDDLVEADEVRDVFAFQRGSFVVEVEPASRNSISRHSW
jgi:hypothetical protein